MLPDIHFISDLYLNIKEIFLPLNTTSDPTKGSKNYNNFKGLLPE